MKAGVVVLMILIIIIMIAVSAWVWSENEKEFREIQNITCEQYNLNEEECQRAIEETQGK